MSTRPRRSAATKAKETISVHAQWANTSDKRDPDTKPTMSSRKSSRAVRDDPDSAEDSHLDVTVKVGSGKLRQVTRGTGRRSDPFEGGEIVHGKRDRGGKKKYVVDSSPDEEEEEEEEAQIDDDEDDDMEDAEEDAEGDVDMEVDAEGEDVDAKGEEEEEDAEGDVDMDVPARSGPTIKISRSSNTKPPRANAARVVADEDDDDDDDEDDELSDPADSDAGDQTLGLRDEEDDGDVEREEIRVAAGEQDLDSDEDASGEEEEPDLTKMTKRQRARFEDTEQPFMKLSDEVQAKKVFTAEELSMRRQEMARRRRNLSDKRNEEVKMETINKLLKKQAPKVSKKAAAAAAADGTSDDEGHKINPVFIRWTSTKEGSRVAIPDEMVDGPAGRIFQKDTGGLSSGKMVEEVA